MRRCHKNVGIDCVNYRHFEKVKLFFESVKILYTLSASGGLHYAAGQKVENEENFNFVISLSKKF